MSPSLSPYIFTARGSYTRSQMKPCLPRDLASITVQEQGTTVTLCAGKKKTLRQRHRETCLTGVLRLPAVLCFRAPELTWEFRGCKYGTMMEHVAPPQVPPPCSSPTFSLPHVAGAGTCLPAFFPDKKHCCCGHGHAESPLRVNPCTYFPSVLK